MSPQGSTLQGKKELEITLFFPKVNFVQQNSYLILLIAERKKENIDLTNKTKILTLRIMLMIIYVIDINGNFGRVICNIHLFRKKKEKYHFGKTINLVLVTHCNDHVT